MKLTEAGAAIGAAHRIADGVARGAFVGMFMGVIFWLGAEGPQLAAHWLDACLVLAAWVSVGVVTFSLAGRRTDLAAACATFMQRGPAPWTTMGVQVACMSLLPAMWQCWTMDSLALWRRITVPFGTFVIPFVLGIAIDAMKWRRAEVSAPPEGVS